MLSILIQRLTKQNSKGNTPMEKRTMSVISRLKKKSWKANSRGVTIPHTEEQNKRQFNHYEPQ